MLNQESLFSDQNPDADELFKAIRDRKRFISERNYIDMLWKVYEPYADLDFQAHFSKEFHSRYWEMFLTCKCVNIGFPVSKKIKTEGPDIRIKLKKGNIWIEAVVPTSGNGVDAVPDYQSDVAVTVPQEKIILRLSNAFVGKWKKFSKYLSAGVISDGDVCIIAINGNQIPHAINDDGVPYIVKTVFPIGYPYVTIDKETLKKIDEGYKHQDFNVKTKGGSVPKNFFLDKQFSNISAILYSNHYNFSPSSLTKTIFTIVHNPNAKAPISKTLFPGIHYFWKKGTLQLENVH